MSKAKRKKIEHIDINDAEQSTLLVVFHLCVCEGGELLSQTLYRRNSEHNHGGRMKNPDLCSTRDLCEHRRGRHDIIMSILAAAQKGAILSKIIEKANLNTTQAETYLTELESRNFLSKHRMPGKKSIVWKTTSKGLTVIEACQKCARLADKPT